MSMDDLYKELGNFLRQMQGFNEQTSRDWDNLQRAWQNLDALGEKDMPTRQFETAWKESAAGLEKYRRKDMKEYEAFLAARKKALDRFYGHR